MYERILALFSAVPYSPPAKQDSDGAEMDLAAHLTNTSLQTERGEAGVRLLDELVGCHILSGGPRATPQRQPPRPPRAMGQALDPEAIRSARKSQEQHFVISQNDVEDLKSPIELFRTVLDRIGVFF